MEVTLKEFPETKIACIRVYGPFGDSKQYGEAYGKLFAWAKIENITPGNELMIYMMETPEKGPGMATDAGFVVSMDTVGNEEIQTQIIPAGLYAVGEHKAVPQDGFKMAWDQTMGAVKEMEGYEMDETRPCFEWYHADSLYEKRIFHVDIYEPVKPKKGV
eukprot:comp10968_c0_seq1/m.5538 comp10968_c0_seq1/g.5538  ORF comp10968_c0_seq1/g.5538 comp10968_c0_seq1/m.5538 type:complete len:160 (-) comp10968_c0_seq1:164-643(-)